MARPGGFGSRIAEGFRHFMTGRYGAYGADKLNQAILIFGAVLSVASIFVPVGGVKLAMMLLCYGALIFAFFRLLSRNTYRRYQENRKFLQIIERLKDRQHRIYDCPRCRQQVRVPRGKGKISITCPKCKEKFIKKT